MKKCRDADPRALKRGGGKLDEREPEATGKGPGQEESRKKAGIHGSEAKERKNMMRIHKKEKDMVVKRRSGPTMSTY